MSNTVVHPSPRELPAIQHTVLHCCVFYIFGCTQSRLTHNQFWMPNQVAHFSRRDHDLSHTLCVLLQRRVTSIGANHQQSWVPTRVVHLSIRESHLTHRFMILRLLLQLPRAYDQGQPPTNFGCQTELCISDVSPTSSHTVLYFFCCCKLAHPQLQPSVKRF